MTKAQNKISQIKTNSIIAKARLADIQYKATINTTWYVLIFFIYFLQPQCKEHPFCLMEHGKIIINEDNKRPQFRPILDEEF